MGINTSANAIKKAFISNTSIKKIKPGDILLFYASKDKKAITTLGVVETTWNRFKSKEEIYNIVRKRTAYNKNELYQVAKDKKLNNLYWKNKIKELEREG